METAYKEGLKRDEELKKIKENLVSCFVCLCQKITYIVNDLLPRLLSPATSTPHSRS